MKLTNLIVTQDDVRNVDIIIPMMDSIYYGVLFDEAHVCSYHRNGSPNALIKLSRFPDGLVFVHDGHHRLVAKQLCGVLEIYECEYKITDWKCYTDYSKANLDHGWYTPFDPRFEIRKAEFFDFKEEVLSQMEHERIGYIYDNRHKYCKPRTLHTVAELADKIKSRLK